MTTSEWDGTPWGGTPVGPAKAITGPYAGRVETGTYLSALSRSPQKLMRAAQEQFHTNPWIRTAEGVVTRRVVGLPWHLENPDDEELEDEAGGIEGEIIALLERPQAKLENIGRKMTRRSLWSVTSRHMGLCGMAYWYLDQMDTNRLPLGIIYVNPARVWAAADGNGNLTGWVLDAADQTGRGGTPLSLDELLPFYLDEPDSGHYGSGLVESAWQKAQITMLADRHAAYVLGTGGRLPGIVSPKEGTIPDEAFKALVAEFRNVNEAPDAAKRTTVVRGPIEFTTTSADPGDLLLIDLSKMNRDDILAVWGVPPTQAAIPAPAGLNSGQAKNYDEAILMQGSVHDRVNAIRETIQFGLLDRWQKVGVTVELEIEEPSFDDATPAYENAARAVNIPLTNAERRAIIGLDPTGDEAVDGAILLPITLTPFDATPPAPVAPKAPAQAMPMEAMQGQMQGPMKAAADRAFLGLRRKMDARYVPTLRKGVAAALRDQRMAIAGRIREHGAKLAKKPADTTVWWTPVEEERLAKILRAGSTGLAQTVARQVGALLETPRKASPVAYEDEVVAYVGKRTGERITAINTTTREAVQAAVIEGFERGLSPAQVADVIEGLTTFDEYRAELVARTESMLAYNDAALTSYGEFGVTDVLAFDGDEDEDCAARNGQTYSIEEAADILDHPNGTLDWAPVVGRAYWDEPAKVAAPPILRLEVGEPPVIPAPIVNVEAQPVHPAPIVNVDTAPIAAMLERALSRQPRIIRDANGRITGVEMVAS